MSKVIKIVVGAALVVAGVVTGNFSLIFAGLTMVGGALLGPKTSSTDRTAAAATIQVGEVPRQAILGKFANAGSLVDAFNYGGKYGTDWEVLVIALADHRCDGLEGFFVNDTYVAYAGDGAVAGYNGQLEVYWRPGTMTQAALQLLIDHGPGWTANDRGAGVAYVVVAYKADASDAENPVWPGGRPRFRWVVRGLRCYDARKDSTVGGSGAHRWDDPSTWEWSENLSICRYNWVRGIYAGDQVTHPEHLLVGRGLSEIEAPQENVFARANLCDEVVDGAARYRIGAIVDAGEAYIDVENDFAAACGGTIVQREGSVEVDPGEAQAAIAHFTDDDLVIGSRVTWSSFLGTADQGWINTAVATFNDPAQAWKERSAPPARDISDIQADGAPREQQMRLSMVSWIEQAGRVAEIARRFGRLWGRAEVTLPPQFAFLEEGDWVTWQSDRHFGGATYTLRVDAWGSKQDWHHNLVLRQISASVYSDTAPLDDGAVAVQQPAPIDVAAPGAGAWALTAGVQDAGGVQSPVLVVTGQVDDPAASLVRIEYYQGVDPLGAGAIWTEAGIAAPDVTRREIPVASGGTFYAGISYVVDGVTGPRLLLGPVTVAALSYPNGDPLASPQLGVNITDESGELLTDVDLLNSQQQWGDVGGAGKPEDNATYGATAAQLADITAALAAAENAQATADGKIVSYYEPVEPFPGVFQTSAEGDDRLVMDFSQGFGVGDEWLDTDDGNHPYRWDGVHWISVQDGSIAVAAAAAAEAQGTADGKVTTFVSETEPTPEGVGDLWFKPSTGELKRWDGTDWSIVSTVGGQSGVNITDQSGELLTDVDLLNSQQQWSDVGGAGKPEDGAQVNPADLAALDSTAATKLTGIEAGATVGAQAGTNLLNAGGQSITDADILNTQVSIGADGTLSGAGGGQVTIGGLGYTGALNATHNTGALADLDDITLAKVTDAGAFAALSSIALTDTRITSKSLANLDSTAATKLTGIEAGAQVNPADLAELDSTAATKLSGIEAGAQVNPADLAALDSTANTKLSGIEAGAQVNPADLAALDSTAASNITQSLADAASAQSTADRKATTYISDTEPFPGVFQTSTDGDDRLVLDFSRGFSSGDLWLNKSEGTLKRWSPDNWGEALADLTSSAVPYHSPASLSVGFTANYQGNLDDGQLPKNIQLKRYRGSTDVSSDATWSIVSQGAITGGTVTVSDGGVTIPEGCSIPLTGEVRVKSIRDGFEITTTITVTRIDAAAPNTGTGSGTTVTDNTLNAISSTSMIAVSDVMTVHTGSSGDIAFSGNLALIAQAALPTGSFGAVARWKWRAVGGSFADVGSANINDSQPAVVYTEGNNFYTSEFGSIEVTDSKTGLSADTDYEVQLWAARDSTTTKTLNFGGTVSATGS